MRPYFMYFLLPLFFPVPLQWYLLLKENIEPWDYVYYLHAGEKPCRQKSGVNHPYVNGICSCSASERRIKPSFVCFKSETVLRKSS